MSMVASLKTQYLSPGDVRKKHRKMIRGETETIKGKSEDEEMKEVVIVKT